MVADIFFQKYSFLFGKCQKFVQFFELHLFAATATHLHKREDPEIVREVSRQMVFFCTVYRSREYFKPSKFLLERGFHFIS